MVVGKKPMNHKILFLTFLSVFVNWNVVGQAFSDEEIVILAKNYDDIGSEVHRAVISYTRQDGIDLICDNSDSGSGVIVSGKQIKASPQDIVQLYCGQIEPFLKDYLERNRIYRIQFKVRVCYKEYAR